MKVKRCITKVEVPTKDPRPSPPGRTVNSIDVSPERRLPVISSRLTKDMKLESLWNMYKDGVTQGLLGAFRACPEKARLQSVEGLAPIRTGGALSFGSLFHEALDHIYTYAMQWGEYPSVEDVLATLYEQDMKKLNKDTTADHSTAIPEIELNYGMAAPLLGAYVERWSNDLSLYNWLALEQRFGEPGDNCVWVDEDGLLIPIRGKFDGVMRMNGKLWLFETKTKARIDDPVIASRLAYDLQVNLYLWAIRRKYGERPVGVVYNLVRRPQLQQGKKETLKAFCERIAADINSRSDFYFTRLSATILPREQDRWEAEFNDMMNELVRWYKGGFHYRDSNACGSPYACQYLPVCGANDRTWLRRREEVYPELLPGGDLE